MWTFKAQPALRAFGPAYINLNLTFVDLNRSRGFLAHEMADGRGFLASYFPSSIEYSKGDKASANGEARREPKMPRAGTSST